MSGTGNGNGVAQHGTEYEPAPESEDYLAAQLDAAKRRIAELERELSTETLTSLTRRKVIETLMQAHVTRGRAFGVIMIDLDGTKRINDHHGHAAGDELIRRAADAIRENIREIDGDVAARWGGDEFLVLIRHGDDIENVAARIQHCVFRDVCNQGAGASVGAARYPNDSITGTWQDVVAVADSNMYAQKRERKAGR